MLLNCRNELDSALRVYEYSLDFENKHFYDSSCPITNCK